MTQEQTLQHFVENVLDTNRSIVLLALETLFENHREELVEEFLDSFRHICRNIHELQLLGGKEKIAYLTYSMLRTEIASGRFAYLVEASDSNWFLDRSPYQDEYVADWAMNSFMLLEEELEKGSQQYTAVITRIKLEKLLLKETHYMNTYVASLIRYAMPRAVKLPEFQALRLEDEFEVRVGEYLDKSESVYKVDKQIRNPDDVREWLNEKNENEYAYESINDLDLSDGDYGSIDFRYTSFSYNNLSRSRFNRCILVGTRWEGSMLEATDFSESLLVGADFSGCQLQGAKFRNVEGIGVRPESMILFVPGAAPLNFQNAKLNGADITESFLPGTDFTGADLAGADFRGSLLNNAIFTGADLTDTNFTGASMDGALFSKETAGLLTLDDEQKKVIYVVWPTEEGDRE
ncbi:MAG: pentapeptide repeat-containing protein [Candidatus Pristimantibacillus sp.]